jgi:hypothetical protein
MTSLTGLGINPFPEVDAEFTRWERDMAELNVRAERAGRVLQHMQRAPETRFLPRELTIPLALTDAEVEDALADLREAGYVECGPVGDPSYTITAAGIGAVAQHNSGQRAENEGP